ncbi:hypothetical protein P3T36_005039 [Kitasatospora sp. MAP12-15]|uniref:DUF5819 family protein n=1 Tax=unclassified Kitasatospora TaxID=2633591 RepID=UPI002476CF3F|nr:DUF5819 family protein [Kitasatospora sp. MAP12-44]MDH6111984.1 hypothetical protein [Kitasatospora sp. MAP12-44]
MTDDGERVWSLPALTVLVAAAVVLAACSLGFLGAVFLHVAPPNTLYQQDQKQVDGLIYPEFEQNWKLFAPDPLQQNVTVDARVRTAQGTGGWIGLTAQDIAAIRGNPIPSHADQNLLRRAWDFYDTTHSAQDDSATGPNGALAQEYLKRIALQRIGREVGGSAVTGIQFRAGTGSVAPPPWSRESWSTQIQYRDLGWWPVDDQDYRGL